MIEPCPCNGCTERFIACSDRCPKDARNEYGYKAWKERYHAQQKHLEDNKSRWQAPFTVAGEQRHRSYLKYGPGNFKGGSK